MCGRKTLTKGKLEIIEELLVDEWDESEEYSPNYNIAPTQMSPVLRYTNHRQVNLMRWGLIPSWSKGPDSRFSMINARSETLTEKPAYRKLLDRKRCVVISDGYYEWQRKGTFKQPYYIHHTDGSLMPMAGLWDVWINPEGQPVHSYTIVTTDAGNEISFIHPRMPVVIPKNQLDIWLRCDDYSQTNAIELLHSYSVNLDYFPVSTIVNSPANNSPDCIGPL